MNTLHRRTSGYAGLTSLFLLFTAVAQGCGNDNPEPTTPVVTGGTSAGGSGAKGGKGGSGGDAGADNPGGSDTGGTTSAGGTGSGAKGGTGSGGKGGTGSGAKGGKGGTGSSAGGAGGTTGGTGNTGNEGGDGNQGGDGPIVDCSPQGEGKDRCYPCAPTDGENAEFLNHCNDASCSHFDNEARIEGFTTPLPPL